VTTLAYDYARGCRPWPETFKACWSELVRLKSLHLKSASRNWSHIPLAAEFAAEREDGPIQTTWSAGYEGGDRRPGWPRARLAATRAAFYTGRCASAFGDFHATKALLRAEDLLVL